MYRIQANITVSRTSSITGETHSFMRQIPTFFLDENILGIVDENHAEMIARDILDYPTIGLSKVNGSPDVSIDVVAIKID